MFKKVLICSDLSDASDLLIACVGDLNSIGVKEAIILHVADETIPIGFDETLIGNTRSIIKENYPALPELISKLEKQKAILEQGGINATIEIVHGIPAQAINELAEINNVSAIILGSHGKGIMKKATLGSVSTEVLHTAKKPVFLVKAKLENSNEVILSCQQLFNHILYLTDFSSTALKALDYLEKIVQGSKVPVTVMHIRNSFNSDEYLHITSELDAKLIEKIKNQNLEEIKSDLASIKRRLEAAGSSRVEVDYPKGRPIDVVIDTIKNNKNISMIVMGSQGKGFVTELFLGSLSLQVTRYCPLPILLIPATSN